MTTCSHRASAASICCLTFVGGIEAATLTAHMLNPDAELVEIVML